MQLQSGTWTDTFPENQVTQQQSTVFVKKLLAIAVSNIAYLRVIFPEKAFSDRRLEDLNLKILKNDKSCPLAVQLIEWLKGVFDAVEKKYLRMLILGIYRHSGDPNTLLEMYTFRFSYTDKTEMEIYSGDQKISSTASQTKKATISLLRNLVYRIQTLRALPNDARIMMKLFYYDEVTPEDYEPPGFRAAQADFICMEGNPRKFRFQNVSTAFHTLQLRMIAEDAATGSDDEAESVLHDQLVTQEDARAMDDAETVGAPSQHDPLAVFSTPQHTPEELLADDAICSDVEPMGVRCPCLANEDDGVMIKCSVCRYWQHAVCFKILEEAAAPPRHVCNLCGNSGAGQPTDPELTGVQESEAQAICLWRRCLFACLEITYFSSDQLATRLNVSDSVAHRLIDRLMSEGYATPRGKIGKAKKYVQKRKIKREALVKYLSGNNVIPMDIEP